MKIHDWSKETAERQRLGAKLSPALRDFVDRVIVPALTREYIAEHGSGNHIANCSDRATVSREQEAFSRADSVSQLRCAIYARFSSDRQSPTSIKSGSAVSMPVLMDG